MFDLIPPQYKLAAAIAGVTIVAVSSFGAGWTVQGWRWEAKQADQALAVLDATHAGWVRSTERWAQRDRDRLTIDVTNEIDLAAFRGGVDQLQENIDHAELVPPDQAAAVCPDPRGPEWLRLYRAAAAGSTEGPAAGAADRVPAGPP